MSQVIEVPNPLTTAQIADINAHLAAIKVIVDGAAIPLTASQTKSMIKVSTMRVALIKDVDINIINIYPAVVPDSISIADFRADMAYAGQLNSLMGMINAQGYGIISLLKTTNNNQMVETTMILDSARGAMGTNAGLTTKMNELSSKHFNSKPGKNKPSSYKTPPGTKVTLGGVIPGKLFTNTGTSVLTLLNVDGNIADTLIVNPYTGIKIPKGWTNVVITNLSDTADASYSVYMKK